MCWSNDDNTIAIMIKRCQLKERVEKEHIAILLLNERRIDYMGSKIIMFLAVNTDSLYS